ncbi:PREDICTED: uncharacterized protein LOC109178661 [Ipomoea nil]|uniref:uncharacterized protein LOC109178661 n=1 Tax=Ipomoea nil TaxID=35883 RepID=UPI0009017300|nr:PREDICTED: uncharacterized protein LOC109178661 [Ipomoea nil]
MAQDDDVNPNSSSSTQIEPSSESEGNPNETIFEMMMDFKVIKNTYSKLKEENSRLLISYDELRRVRIKNIELAITNDQLEKQVRLLKELCTERELREQHLCEVLDSFNNSSILMDQLVNGSKLAEEITEIGFDPSSSAQTLLNKLVNSFSQEGFRSMFVQGATQQPEPMTKIDTGKQPQPTSQPKGKAVQQVLEPQNGRFLKGNPRHNANVKRNGPKVNRPSLYYQKGQPTRTNKRKEKHVIWYVDSGCSRHMIGDKSNLSNYREVDGPKVVFGGESSGKTPGTGDIIKHGIVIRDVSHGYKVEFSKDECKVISTKDGDTVLTARRKKNMYVVNWELSKINVCLVAKNNADLSWEWHNKMIHLNLKTINKLAKKDLVEGLPKVPYVKDRICEACQKGKQIKA